MLEEKTRIFVCCNRDTTTWQLQKYLKKGTHLVCIYVSVLNTFNSVTIVYSREEKYSTWQINLNSKNTVHNFKSMATEKLESQRT